MLQFEVKEGTVIRAIVVDANNEEICGARCTPENKMEVAAIVVDMARNLGYDIPKRSSRT